MSTLSLDRRQHVGFQEAADYLGISQKTLERKIIASGLLAWYDFNGSRRIRRSDLLQFAESSRLVGARAKDLSGQQWEPADDSSGQTATDPPSVPQPPS